MKSIYLIILLFISYDVLYAQKPDDPQYLFNQKKLKISGFGGPFISFTNIKSGLGVISGGEGAVLFNQTFFVGGYGMGLISEHTRDDVEAYDELFFNYGQAGLWFGYINKYYNIVHFGLSTKVGMGNLKLTDKKKKVVEENEFASDNVFVCIPQIEVEVSVTHWCRINFGLGYQFIAGFNSDESYKTVTGTTRQNFERKDYSGTIGTISLYFGGFGQVVK